jgi:hypothetical protein
MSALVVLENAKRWPLVLEEAEVVTAEDYLLQPDHAERRGVRVYNLCRTYGYQTLGYYVSLLAAARGHRPLPSVDTLQDLRVASLVRLVSEDLDALIQRSLAPLQGDRFVLSVYFGRNLAKRYDALSRALFDQYPVPLLRAAFSREQRWRLVSIRPIATSEIPEAHREFVLEQAAAHFRRPHRARRARPAARYDLAILADPEAEDAPSDAAALRRFVRAAREFDIEATIVGAGDYGAIAEFDALFIRETTRVNHHTYRFARRAKAEGLVVIDDPESILRCTNKVFQHELFARRRIPSPRTVIVHEDNAAEVVRSVGLPCVLKRPDGSFSRGVERPCTTCWPSPPSPSPRSSPPPATTGASASSIASRSSRAATTWRAVTGRSWPRGRPDGAASAGWSRWRSSRRLPPWSRPRSPPPP